MVMAFVAAAIAMLVALIPAGIVLYRGELVASVVAYEFITSVVVMVLALRRAGFPAPEPVRAAGGAGGAPVWQRAGLRPRAGALAVMGRQVVADVLLGLAVVTTLGASVGVLVMRDAYQKLHFVTPAALVAPLLVALAIFVQMGLVENTGETFLALLFMVIGRAFLEPRHDPGHPGQGNGRLAPP